MKKSGFSKKRADIQDEFDRYVEGRLNQAEIDAIEVRMEEDAELKASFVEYLHLHALLQVDGERLLAGDNEKVIEFPSSQRWAMALRYAAVVSFLLGCVWLLRGSFEQQAQFVKVEGSSEKVSIVSAEKDNEVTENKDVTVATLAHTLECKWAGSSLPTANGARLGLGRLHLLEGLATVVFDGGAQVTMEAPALMEVISAEKCRLISGGLVGWVRKGAEGFQVVTEDALVTDYGTRFGVTIGESGQSEVVVLEGEVGVEHSKVKGEKRLEMGEALRYDASSFLPVKEGGINAIEPDRNAGLGAAQKDRAWKTVSTADKGGKDTYVRQDNGGGPFGLRPLVMVKKSAKRTGNQRKIYLGFDLQSLGGEQILEAELVLAIRSSGLGFASVVPDSVFSVYGLKDESLDEWDELGMTWENAPANDISHGARLQASKVVKLGAFEIKQGVSSGFRSVKESLLADFLNEDSNQAATLIVVRESDQDSGNGLVHAFASREHPTAMAPTLRLKLAE